MRGLRKYLTPFAPDQSGAVSVLYELGGIIVICDAGGCTGNVCGFDEPRWFERKSAVFSACLLYTSTVDFSESSADDDPAFSEPWSDEFTSASGTSCV